MRWRRHVIRLGLFGAGLLMGFLAVEGLSWVFGLGAGNCGLDPPAGFIAVEPFHRRGPANYQGTLDCPRSGLGWPRRVMPFRTNSLGFRDPERSKEPDPGTTRIVMLGDSFAMGYGVRREAAFPMVLEKLLNARFPAHPFEIINLGVGGQNTEMEANLYTSLGRQYRPDLVLVVHVLNDAEMDPDQRQVAGEEIPVPGHAAGEDGLPQASAADQEPGWLSWAAGGVLDRCHRWSRFCRAGYDVWRWQIMGRERANMRGYRGRQIRDFEFYYLPGSPGWASVTWGMKQIARTSRRDGSRSGMILFPMMIGLDRDYPYQKVHDRVLAAAAAEGMATLDLLPAFAGQEDRDRWITATDSHPDEEAHRIAAAALARWLADELLAPDGTPRPQPVS